MTRVLRLRERGDGPQNHSPMVPTLETRSRAARGDFASLPSVCATSDTPRRRWRGRQATFVEVGDGVNADKDSGGPGAMRPRAGDGVTRQTSCMRGATHGAHRPRGRPSGPRGGSARPRAPRGARIRCPRALARAESRRRCRVRRRTANWSATWDSNHQPSDWQSRARLEVVDSEPRGSRSSEITPEHIRQVHDRGTPPDRDRRTRSRASHRRRARSVPTGPT